MYSKSATAWKKDPCRGPPTTDEDNEKKHGIPLFGQSTALREKQAAESIFSIKKKKWGRGGIGDDALDRTLESGC